MTTPADALNFLLATIERSPDSDLLTDALTRLGLLCGGREDNLMLLATFEAALGLTRRRRVHIEALKVAKRIGE